MLRKEAELREIAQNGQRILLNLEKESWVKVNDTAIAIIEMINNLPAVDGVNKIVAKYKVTRETAQSFIDYLLNKGILKKEQQFNNIRLLEEEEKPKPPIPIGYLHITNKCNLSCGYCSYNANNRPEEEPSVQQIKSIIRKLSQNRISQIVFSGGEPLCRKEFRAIISYARQFFDDIGLVTNGTLIDSENGEFIANNIDKIQVSLDSGIQEDHDAIRGEGSFAKTIRGLKILRGYGHQQIRITPTINKININNIESIVEIAKKLAVTLSPRFFLPVGRGSCNEESYSIDYAEMVRAFKKIFLECERLQYDKYTVKSFYESYEKPKVSCAACKGIVCINPNGDVYPCSFLMEEDFKMGNLLEVTDLHQLIANHPVGRGIMERSVEKIDGCKDCAVRYFCASGCLAIYYKKTGLISGADNECHALYELLNNLFWKSEEVDPKSLLQTLDLEIN